jgi:hypothetical protein
VTRRVNGEQESGLAGSGVRDPMKVSAADHGGVARPEHAVFAAGPEPDRTRHDLETLVLTDVEMPGDEAAGLEAYLGSERLTLGIDSGLEKGQELTGQRILDRAVSCAHVSVLPSAVMRRHASVLAMLLRASRRALACIPGTWCRNCTHRGITRTSYDSVTRVPVGVGSS